MNESSKAHSPGKVPFSWEIKPGIRRETYQECSEKYNLMQKLPPPPCRSQSAKVPFSWEIKPGIRRETYQNCSEKYNLMQKLPPPPCRPQSAGTSVPPPPPFRTSSRRGFKKSDDPFLAAYKECTRSTSSKVKKDGGSGMNRKKGIFSFSCKQSCSVRDDNLVRISLLPLERDISDNVSKSENLFVNF